MEKEGILEHVREVGPYFLKQLKSLEALPIVGEVRGNHFMVCIENVANKKSRALFSDDVNIGQRITDECASRGVLIRPIGHLNVLSPSLILTINEIDKIVTTLHDGILAVMADLQEQGLWST